MQIVALDITSASVIAVLWDKSDISRIKPPTPLAESEATQRPSEHRDMLREKQRDLKSQSANENRGQGGRPAACDEKDKASRALSRALLT